MIAAAAGAIIIMTPPDTADMFRITSQGGYTSGAAPRSMSQVSRLNPNDPRQYARVDHLGIFVDSRLSSFLLSRVSQVMSGYLIDDPVSLCAFAALDRSPDDMLSWVLIRDLRKAWPGEETTE